jgi:pyruvate dehydrogenase E2 component (dihydrolipoamide acetyltransferase)
MGAGYHHLYEWGNCPMFVMAGQIEDRAIVVDGEVVVEPILPLRFSFDERINDGLTAKSAIDLLRDCLERPDQYISDVNE